MDKHRPSGARRRLPGALVLSGLFALGLVPLMAAPATAATFSNTTPQSAEIVQLDGPYKVAPDFPSSINVSGLSGVVTNVKVTLNDFSAQDRDPGFPGTDGYPEDSDILLEAPDGTNLLLMSDIGGDNQTANEVTGVDITIDDAAALNLPVDTGFTSNSAVTGKPTDDDDDPDEDDYTDAFSNPLEAPPDTYSFSGPTPSANTTFAAFDGLAPNGDWDLYMVDDFGGPETVHLDGGWTIDITTSVTPLPSLYIDNVSITEGGSGTKAGSARVRLSPTSTSTVTVNVSSANATATAGSDYVAVPPTTLTFTPGTASQIVNFTINGDVAREGNETLFLNLTAPSGAVLGDNKATVLIIDEEAPYFVYARDAFITEGNAGTSVVNVPVLLQAAVDPGQSVTVNVQTTNVSATAGSDYVAVPLTPLTFNAGEISKNVAVTVNGDVTSESNETFRLDLSGQSGNAAIGDSQGLVTIVNDEVPAGSPPLPSLYASDRFKLESNAGTQTMTFAVNLSPSSGSTVTVNAQTADAGAVAGSDYVALPSTPITFNPGETSKIVTVNVNGDLHKEGNENLLLNLSSPSGAVLGDNSGFGTIIDEEGPFYAYVSDTSVLEGQSGTSVMNVAVSISAVPAAGQTVTVKVITVDVSATAGSDYVAVPLTTVTFNAGESVKNVAVTVNGDTSGESNETFRVDLSAPSGNAVLGDTQGLQTIINDD